MFQYLDRIMGSSSMMLCFLYPTKHCNLRIYLLLHQFLFTNDHYFYVSFLYLLVFLMDIRYYDLYKQKQLFVDAFIHTAGIDTSYRSPNLTADRSIAECRSPLPSISPSPFPSASLSRSSSHLLLLTFTHAHV